MTITMFTQETEEQFYVRIQHLRVHQWIYLSCDERRMILDYLHSFRKIEYPDPALKDNLRCLLDRLGF